ncbi:MAG: ImmA/IrrE family metallo-endopeptidase [Gammaproteobacteria bacterium]|nr:ImmA/IrrE family metallo-endopeptidase [Gammaproteobacteria bacterium]
MIYSEKQYTRSKRLLQELNAARVLIAENSTTSDWLKQAELSGLDSQITKTKNEIKHFEKLRDGRISLSKSYSLQELPTLLVDARIAKNLSQTDLAHLLNLSPQQIQRYEATSYMGASLAKLIEVASVLGVQISGMINPNTRTENRIFISWKSSNEHDWSKLPSRHMAKRGWIPKGSEKDLIVQARDYVREMLGRNLSRAHHRKKLRADSKLNEYHLMAWQARIIELSLNIIAQREVVSYKFDEHNMKRLRNMTTRRTGPAEAREFLLSKGVVLVMEPHLPRTYLDGMAMLLNNGTPIIGLTLRHNRVDNFWFTLFHEIGHVLLHLKQGLVFDFFDQEDAGCNDNLEKQADHFAVEKLIPESVWRNCLAPYVANEETVTVDAEKLDVHPAIVAGRVRKERGDYQLLSALVRRDKIDVNLEVESVV